MPQSRVLFDPAARWALQQGFNILADAMQVTLGPRGRLVAVGRENPRRPPELLSDGATIARRFLGLPDRFQTMGSLLARHIAWQVKEAVGDGSTTAVVIARSILNAGNRHIAAGHDVMAIRRGLEKALSAVEKELRRSAQPLEDPDQIAALATAITGSEVLGRHIEEIFDIVGPYGAVDVRSNYARTHDRQYIQGAFWNRGWISSHLAEAGKAVLKNPYILLTSRQLSQASELLPIMEQVRQADQRGLVVIAPVIEKDALNILVTNKVRKALPTLGIKAPGVGYEKMEILQDLAVLCGGKLLADEAGQPVERASLADLGQAAEVQAIRSGFTVVGGKGRPASIRQRIQEIQREIPNAPDRRTRERLQARAGKLLGGVALLQVGGDTETEQEYLKERAKEAVRTVRLGLADGIVPGGGAAFLSCLPVLETLDLPDDEAVSIAILQEALLAPMRAILRNAGFDPNPILYRVQANGCGYGFDVVRERVCDMLAANIVDPVTVCLAALRTGVSGATMGLSTEVLVHKPRLNRDEEVRFKP